MTPLEILSRTFSVIPSRPRRRRNDPVPEVDLCGVYLLVLAGEIIYVGASQVIYKRLYTQRHGSPALAIPPKLFDRVLWHPLEFEQLDEVEGALIRAIGPRL